MRQEMKLIIPPGARVQRYSAVLLGGIERLYRLEIIIRIDSLRVWSELAKERPPSVMDNGLQGTTKAYLFQHIYLF